MMGWKLTNCWQIWRLQGGRQSGEEMQRGEEKGVLYPGEGGDEGKEEADENNSVADMVRVEHDDIFVQLVEDLVDNTQNYISENP